MAPARFIGAKNYMDMMADPYFWRAVHNNLIYVLVVVLMQVGGGLFLAIQLVNVRRGQNLIKTLYYVPVIIVTVAIARRTYSSGLRNRPSACFSNSRTL